MPLAAGAAPLTSAASCSVALLAASNSSSAFFTAASALATASSSAGVSQTAKMATPMLRGENDNATSVLISSSSVPHVGASNVGPLSGLMSEAFDVDGGGGKRRRRHSSTFDVSGLRSWATRKNRKPPLSPYPGCGPFTQKLDEYLLKVEKENINVSTQ